jgi:hypothetical protein
MESLSVISTVRLLPESKTELNRFITNIKEAVLNGEINALEMDYRLKFLEELVDGIRKDKDIRDCVIDEVSKYEKTFTFKNATITLSERKSYDYSNDGEHKAMKEKLKEREALLKGLPDRGMVDPATGEMLYPPIVKKSDVITYKINQ